MTHPKYGGNVNEPLRDGPAMGLLMCAEPGKEPSLDQAVAIYVGTSLEELRGNQRLRLQQLPPDRPKNLAVAVLDKDAVEAVKPTDPCTRSFGSRSRRPTLSEASLQAARRAVEAGATLVFSGKAMPLLAAYARSGGDKSHGAGPGGCAAFGRSSAGPFHRLPDPAGQATGGPQCPGVRESSTPTGGQRKLRSAADLRHW